MPTVMRVEYVQGQRSFLKGNANEQVIEVIKKYARYLVVLCDFYLASVYQGHTFSHLCFSEESFSHLLQCHPTSITSLSGQHAAPPFEGAEGALTYFNRQSYFSVRLCSTVFLPDTLVLAETNASSPFSLYILEEHIITKQTQTRHLIQERHMLMTHRYIPGGICV